MGAVKINGQTSGSTTITAPATGGDETIELSTALAGKLPIAGGKILQIVRATDSTDRSTTSTSYVDANLSVTITPQRSNSAILLIATMLANTEGTTGVNHNGRLSMTDTSNNTVSGAEDLLFGSSNYSYSGTFVNFSVPTLVGYATPATTSATTYKIRFRVNVNTTTLKLVNSAQTAQFYAIEVSA